QHPLRLREHVAQGGVRRRDADAQIAHGGLRQHRVVEADGDGRQQHLRGVGQDLPHQDAAAGGPHQPGALHIIHVPQRREGGAGHPGKAGDEHDPQGDHHVVFIPRPQ
ncbi:Helix-turn-helix domain, partial [Dysosmobacter welbionis]